MKFCPSCAAPLRPRTVEGRERLVCSSESCDYVFYDNNVYFPPSALKRAYYEESETRTTCPYKGNARYWSVKVGDSVKEGDTVVEISTDKVDMELPAPATGTITEILSDDGDTVTMGQVIARMSAGAPAAPPPAAHEPTTGVFDGGGKTTESTAHASPVARRVAAEEGVDLERIKGSARGGRITKADVLAAAGNGAGAALLIERCHRRRRELLVLDARGHRARVDVRASARCRADDELDGVGWLERSCCRGGPRAGGGRRRGVGRRARGEGDERGRKDRGYPCRGPRHDTHLQ